MVIGIVMFLLLGIAFGYAAGWPWGLLAFLIPALLVLGAANKNGAAIVLGFVVTAVGVFVGFTLAARQGDAQTG